MQSVHELVRGIYHWTAIHPDIEQEVHSYYVAGPPGVAIDPMTPPDGLAWFTERNRPEHVLLTNRLHYRDAAAYRRRFQARVWCHEAGLHEFTSRQRVSGFAHGETVAGGILALEVGALTPEETAYLIPGDEPALSLGDSLIRDDRGRLSFVPDAWMGDDPATVRRGLIRSFRVLLGRDFSHLLLAHGAPVVGEGKAALQAFVDAGPGPAAA